MTLNVSSPYDTVNRNVELSWTAIEYTPFEAVMAHDNASAFEYIGNAYKDGNTVDAESDVVYSWSYSADNGATWTALDVDSASYTVSEDSPIYGKAYTIKAVATDDAGRESVVYAYPRTITVTPTDLVSDVAEDGRFVMTFNYGGDNAYVVGELDAYGNARVVNDVGDVGDVELQTSSDSDESDGLRDEFRSEI